MPRFLIFLFSIFLLLFGLEYYLFTVLEPFFSNIRELKWLYWIYQAGGFGTLTLAVFNSRNISRSSPRTFKDNFILGSSVAFFIPKIVVLTLFTIDVFIRGIVYFLQFVFSLLNEDVISFPERSDWWVGLIIISGFLLFLGLIYAVKWGKYRYQLKEVVILSEDVPSEFDGFKIVQFSDVHAGSFDDISKVKKGIDLINKQAPDLVLFTGDMVNNAAAEIEPFIKVFGQIQASHGKFSVLGNHDYGDYVRWQSVNDKAHNLQQLIQNQKEMGFQMMRNETTQIRRNEQSINLLGVENWGKPPFQQYGDLEKVCRDIDSTDFTILMSHDPSHWDEQVKQHPKKVNLTLSGHTHGMQLGIEWLGIKWSPVKYRYRKWAGMYSENNIHLYVNRGFGFLGWPGRLGIWPEVTLITLKKT